MIRKSFLIAALSLVSMFSFSQTAVNFTCNDCNGTSHTLFDELDGGKIIVICWVMPCSSCLGPAKAAYDMVGTFQTSHPNRVYYYLTDDYANSTCSYIDTWANTSGMPDTSFMWEFSNTAIKMTDYGSTGMPKIVVLGTNGHNVFYNINNAVDTSDLHQAIDSALAIAGVEQIMSSLPTIKVYPNPASTEVTIEIPKEMQHFSDIEILNETGQVVQILSGYLVSEKNELTLNVEKLNAGIYFLKFNSKEKPEFLKLLIQK
ncbi:MAG: T9SS type A sorting domain-containing protein [Bacteroidota bacterium]